MEKKEIGKILSIIAGIITLVATFLFTLFSFTLGEDTYYVSGILGIIQLFTILISPYSLVYLFSAIFLLLFLLSGVIQILGFKSRGISWLGSILPIFFAIIIILSSFALVSSEVLTGLYILGTDKTIIQDIIPLNISFGSENISIGSYILLTGGILGLISGILKRGGI